MTHRVVIIGSGPAGLTAAIYAARAKLATTVIAGRAWGGQLMNTTEVENYPGFVDGLLGPDLMKLWRKQAERFGTVMVEKDVTEVDFSKRPLRVSAEGEWHDADAVIIATGATAKWLELESETRLRLKGGGVSACATCDGRFFEGRELVVVGGGDVAMEEATYLTRYASKVTIVHRRDSFRASKIMADRALANPRITVVWNHVVVEVLGKNFIEGVRVRDVVRGTTRDIPAGGLFVAIGHEPNTKLFGGKVALDPKGYVIARDHTLTDVPGVFAAGDVHDHRYRQAVTAAGFGCMAAMDAERWLESTAAK